MTKDEALQIMDILEGVQHKIERANRLLAEYGIEIFQPALHLSDGRSGKIEDMAKALCATIAYSAYDEGCLIKFSHDGYNYYGGTSV